MLEETGARVHGYGDPVVKARDALALTYGPA